MREPPKTFDTAHWIHCSRHLPGLVIFSFVSVDDIVIVPFWMGVFVTVMVSPIPGFTSVSVEATEEGTLSSEIKYFIPFCCNFFF